MKTYKVRVTSPVDSISYDVWSPELGLAACDEAAMHTGKDDNDALQQLRTLFVDGHSVLIIGNGNIVDVDGIPRDKIPADFVLANADAYLGDALVVRDRLTRENFIIEIHNG